MVKCGGTRRTDNDNYENFHHYDDRRVVLDDDEGEEEDCDDDDDWQLILTFIKESCNSSGLKIN